ncbi:MAG: CBS domain-containing protein [Actinomycetota bacterium]|nr:CBS domain-containing protein [Actinomycetota bacterium]
MSPRAAWRLESLGYDAYDYVAGKADWLAFDLPYEGYAKLAGPVASREVPTCSFRDRLGDVRQLLETSRFGMLVALNGRGVVMGRLDHDALDEPDDASVEQLMREGPTTIRPSEQLEPLLERMRSRDVDAVLVTRSDGILLGILERVTAEEALDEPDHAHR